MQPKILLGVIGNGRKELLDQTVASLQKYFPDWNFFHKVLIDDTGNADYQDDLIRSYETYFDEMVLHAENEGLSGSVRSLWRVAQIMEADYIFHVEEDFTFEPLDNYQNGSTTGWRGELFYLSLMLKQNKGLAQVALKRQPCNPAESEVGGFMQQNPDSYTQEYFTSGDDRRYWLSHRNFFTLNPSLYPSWVFEMRWEQGWGEKEFSELLFDDKMVRAGYLGRVSDPPLVTHIGSYRTEGWKV